MSIATDFEIQVDKDIRYIGASHGASGAGYYTVIELHRWLQDLADDASSSGDDFVDITKETPSDRSTDNIITLLGSYNIDDTAAEHLYGGSIIQNSGLDIYDGIKVFANVGMDMQIQQNGAIIANDFWNSIPFGTGLIGINPDAANGISHRFMLKIRSGGTDIDGRRIICQTRVWGKTYSEFKINGTTRGENVVALTYADDLNNQTSIGTIAGYTDITNTEGYRAIDVNNDAVSEYYYSEWNKAARSINDLYERIKWLQRQGSASTMYGLNGEVFRGITHELTVDSPTGTFSAVEALSWSGGTGQLLAINSPTAPTKMWIQLLTGVIPTNNQVITGGTSSATAQLNVTVTERTLSYPAIGVSTGSAIIGGYGFGIEAADLSANDKVFDLTNTQYQAPNNVVFTVSNLISGDRTLVAPLGYMFAYDNEASGPFQIGETLTFTSPSGTAYLSSVTDKGTYGFMNIRMLTGSVPTDNSTITGGTSSATANVNGTVNVSQDSRQLKLATTLSGASETSVVVTSTIPSDTPASGTIRIQLNSGVYRRVAYTSYSGSTFTINSTNFTSGNATGGAGETGNSVFISYIDDLSASTTMSFTSVYSSDRNLFVRVRHGSGSPLIKTYETSATLGSAGGSASTSRISDE